MFKSKDVLTEDYLSIGFWDSEDFPFVTIATIEDKEIFYLFDYIKIWQRKTRTI